MSGKVGEGSEAACRAVHTHLGKQRRLERQVVRGHGVGSVHHLRSVEAHSERVAAGNHLHVSRSAWRQRRRREGHAQRRLRNHGVVESAPAGGEHHLVLAVAQVVRDVVSVLVLGNKVREHAAVAMTTHQRRLRRVHTQSVAVARVVRRHHLYLTVGKRCLDRQRREKRGGRSAGHVRHALVRHRLHRRRNRNTRLRNHLGLPLAAQETMTRPHARVVSRTRKREALTSKRLAPRALSGTHIAHTGVHNRGRPHSSDVAVQKQIAIVALGTRRRRVRVGQRRRERLSVHRGGSTDDGTTL